MWLLIACLVTSWSLFWPRRHWSLCVRSWPSFGLEHGCTRCVFAVKFYVFWKTKPSLVSLSNFDALFMHVSFVSFTLFMHFLHFFIHFLCTFYAFLINFLCISYALFMHFLYIFYTLFMHFLCTFYAPSKSAQKVYTLFKKVYALFMHFLKAHKKCIKSAQKMHKKCIKSA